MSPNALLARLALLEAVLLAATWLFYLGRGALRDRSRRIRGERLGRGRTLLSRVISGAALAPEDAAWLRGLPRATLLGLTVEVAASVRGTERERLRKLGRELGLLDGVEAETGSFFWWRRLRAARLLTLLDTGDHVMPGLARDPHPLVRSQAAEWAAGRSDAASAAMLLGMLADPARQCRFTVKDSLLRLGAAAEPLLADYLRRPDPAGLPAALDVAAAIGEPRLLPPVARLAGHPEPVVRRHAVLALGALGGADAVAALERALADPEPVVREAAAAMLGRLRHWPAAAALAAALQDRSWDVRLAAGTALRDLGAPGLLLLQRTAARGEGFAADMARHSLDVGRALGELPA